jgi:serine/threonine protein kinase
MSEADKLVGTIIAGKYRIRALIGVGGMGAVYEGEHLDLGKKVAVKLLDNLSDTSAELATRFKREARAASAVESEGIVQVFDVGRDPEVGLYMVMELLHGEDLEARLRKQPGRRLDPVVVAQIGHQAARALVKAHAARVIHRDLKPANLFLTEREDGSLRVKILDFGISKLLASEASIATNKEMLELTAAGVALGTPQYMSPEQAQGLTTVDHRADVWGLGVVLYEALTGIPAFPELRTYQETIINLLQNPPQPLSSVAPWVPEPLARVVHDALIHDVSRRIQDCATFVERLEAAFPDSALSATTGAFSAAEKARRKLTPSAHTARPQMPPPVGFSALAPPLPPRPGRSARPPTIADDTQVVVRTNDAEAFEDPLPSATMLADSTRSPPGGGEPKVEIIDSSAPGAPSDDPSQAGAEDRTVFQSPAWVESQTDGPATVRTGLSVDEKPNRERKARVTQAMSAALTAVIVVLVGGFVLLFALRSSTPETSAATPPAMKVEAPATVTTPAPAAPNVADTPSAKTAELAVTDTVEAGAASADVRLDSSVAEMPSVAAPPSTGTAAIPVAPPTGAPHTDPPPARAEASAAAAK